MESGIAVTIKRYDPETEKRWEQSYFVPTQTPLSVLGILDYIQEELDPTLAYRPYRCYVGVCVSCQISVNGSSTRGCSAAFRPGETVLLEPSPGGNVVRDLVTRAF